MSNKKRKLDLIEENIHKKLKINIDDIPEVEYVTPTKNRININNDNNNDIKRLSEYSYSSNDGEFLEYMARISANWDKLKTPRRSSIVSNKSQARIPKSVKFSNVFIRNYNQSGGINSCGVTAKGPSLHLGTQLIDEIKNDIESFEDKRKRERKGDRYAALTQRQRVLKLNRMNKNDKINKRKLKDENDQLRVYNKCQKVGCSCKSIFNQTCKELKINIKYFIGLECNNDKKIIKNEMKQLNKLKKKELIDVLKECHIKKYGKIDVCCVDERCNCFKNGIECFIDHSNSLLCQCGGNILYLRNDNNNDSNININTDNISKDDIKKSDKRRKLAFACGNDSGNDYNINVLKYDINKFNPNEIKSDEIGNKYYDIKNYREPINSPKIKKKLQEWQTYYDA